MTTPTFAHVLAALRTKRGWSQTRLAHEAGYDHSFLSRIEAGKRLPSAETVQAFADILDLDRYDTARLYRAAGYWPPSVVGAMWVAICEMKALLNVELVFGLATEASHTNVWRNLGNAEDRALAAAERKEGVS